ncbi:MAG TPA: Hsp20/alpha crystallin family protein [Chloroflexota bacterium]|nr:Hsp20/alpha crystallin family protein [Chloroflexota bacterium]
MATYLEPFRDFVSLREAMNSLLEDSFVRPFSPANGLASRSVPVDIWQTENELVVRASVPGVRPDDLSISVLNGVLTLKGEHKAEAAPQGAHYLRQEIAYGTWERSFELPFSVQADKAEAHFEHGMLTVTLPKAEEAKPRQIKITANGSHAIEGEKVSS